MRHLIDLEALLAPIPGENPAGEDLRFTDVFSGVAEARRTDEWQPEPKKAEYDKVVELCADAIAAKSKDLRLAVWLIEGLVSTDGFQGLAAGLEVMAGMLERYWESCYPLIEDGHFDSRCRPLQFLDEKVSVKVREVPLTEPGLTPGYSWSKWKESRNVGYEKETRNSYGVADDALKKTRDEKLAEKKLSAEDFDAAVLLTGEPFRSALADSLRGCSEAFARFSTLVSERFRKQAPSLATLQKSIEDCRQVVKRLYPEEPLRQDPAATVPAQAAGEVEGASDEASHPAADTGVAPGGKGLPLAGAPPQDAADLALREKALWDEAVKMTNSGGLPEALGLLLAASYSASSQREANRCRLLVAKLCLMVGRPDLARPIAEDLNSMIDELHLDQWESPLWVAEVMGALYDCLSSGEPSDDDAGRAAALFRRICALDVTKAIAYRK